jgi:two-component system NtrC family sensor kinase
MAKEIERIRVLVIDGSRNIRDFVAEQVLIPNGYIPILARDGAEGLHKAFAEVPDLILMDYELPLMSGRDVLETLHARPFRIPVILMTSPGSEAVVVPLLRMGVRDYLVKPFRTDELLQSIQRILFEVQLQRENAALTNQLAQTQQELKRRLVEVSILHEIGKAATDRLPLDVLLERIADAALYVIQAEECILRLKDPETERVTEKVRRRRTPGVVRPIVPGAPPGADQPGKVTAMLHTPLQWGGKEIGVLGVNSKVTLRGFDDHDRQVLRILADYAALAIEMARLNRRGEEQKQ